MELLPTAKLGDIVLWRSPVKDGEKTSPSFSAIVYEVRENNHVGLVVFGFDNIPVRRYGHTPYHLTKEECWRKVSEE